jgi:hypothetical protein
VRILYCLFLNDFVVVIKAASPGICAYDLDNYPYIGDIQCRLNEMLDFLPKEVWDTLDRLTRRWVRLVMRLSAGWVAPRKALRRNGEPCNVRLQ